MTIIDKRSLGGLRASRSRARRRAAFWGPTHGAAEWLPKLATLLSWGVLYLLVVCGLAWYLVYDWMLLR